MAISGLAVVALTRLFINAVDYWTADDAEWKPDGKTFKLVDKALATLGVFVGKGSREDELRYQTLVLAAFGDAFRDHWVGCDKLAPWMRGYWLTKFRHGSDAAKLETETRLRIALAFDVYVQEFREKADSLPQGGVEPPIGRPLYQALWQAFTSEKLDDADMEPLLAMTKGEAKAEFERDFRRAWRAGLARSGGASLRAALVDEENQARPEALRELLLNNTASWRRQHVFANVGELDGFPEMPLEDAYVEPVADVVLNGKTEAHSRSRPVLAAIESLKEKHRITFVSAHMGQGKSLTARTLAWQLAMRATDEVEQVSTEMWWPVYVRCCDDYEHDGEKQVQAMIVRALQRQARALGLDLGVDDPAFEAFTRDQKVVLLLDGLDEVALTGRELDKLMKRLDSWTSAKRRCVVFSRPAALPERRKDIPVVGLRQFSDDQVEQWLCRWNWLSERDGPKPEELATKGLAEIARVPILLLMIAYTWGKLAGREDVGKAAVYEGFFREMARGKYEKGGEEHPEVRRAAKQLHGKLAGKYLPANATEVDAMLWLMGRVAWEAKSLEFEGERAGGVATLRPSQIEADILLKELKCSGEALHCIRIGLLLAAQADLRHESHSLMLFGHRSFLEFAVAHFWLTTLELLVSDPSEEFEDWGEEQLMRTPLRVNDEDNCDTFLFELVKRAKAREEIGRWACKYFLDERLLPVKRSEVTLAGDLRTRLRGAALGIACHCRQPPDMKNGQPLRSLLAWASTRGEYLRLAMPGVNLSKLELPRADFTGADLRDAKLANVRGPLASFVQANLVGADLRNATFFGADFFGATLFGASLRGATFLGADLRGAHFRWADLRGAHLEEAHLRQAHLEQANLRGANLRGAHLEEAYLELADLDGANLAGAHLEEAVLFGANLAGAHLARASLRGAHLQGAQLTPDQRAYAKAQGAILDDPEET